MVGVVLYYDSGKPRSDVSALDLYKRITSDIIPMCPLIILE